jgi:hypothetical protein
MYFHGARFSNYEAWLSDPTHIKPSAQVVWPVVGQEILNGDVGGGFQGIQITSGFFQLWRASGITSELQLYSTAIGGLVMAAAMFFAGWFHYHKAAPKLEWFQNVESMLNHHLAGLLGLGSLGWAGHQIHISLPVNKLLDAGVDPKEIPLPHDLILNRQIMADLYPSFAKGLAPFFTLQWNEYSDFLTFNGGLNPVTGGLWLSDTAHHHVAIAVLFLVAGHMYRTNWGIGHSIKEILESHKGPFTGEGHVGLYEILTTSWHAQLAINLALFGSLSIIVAHHMYSMPPYPYLATDYGTQLSLFTHHNWIGGFCIVGAGAHAAIFMVRDYDPASSYNNLLDRVIRHRDAIISHLNWVCIFLGFHSFGLYIHNDTMSALGRPQDMFSDTAIQLQPVFAQWIQNTHFAAPQLTAPNALAATSATWGGDIVAVGGKVAMMPISLGTSDFLVWLVLDQVKLRYMLESLVNIDRSQLVASLAKLRVDQMINRFNNHYLNKFNKILLGIMENLFDRVNQQVTSLQAKKLGTSETTREAVLQNLNYDFTDYNTHKPAHIKTLDLDFLIWLIGFIEGDGSFWTRDTKRSTQFVFEAQTKRAEFDITQHIDNLKLLKYIRTKLGFGKVQTFEKNGRIYCRWYTSQKKNIILLIYLLNGNLILEKRRHQFLKWLNELNNAWGLNIQPKPFSCRVSLQHAWLSGFSEADAGFYTNFQTNFKGGIKPDRLVLFDRESGELEQNPAYYVKFVTKFYITQREEDLVLIEILNLLNIKKPRIYSSTNGRSDYKYNRLEICNSEKIEILIQYFNKYPLRGYRKIDLLRWVRVHGYKNMHRVVTQKAAEKLATLIANLQESDFSESSDLNEYLLDFSKEEKTIFIDLPLNQCNENYIRKKNLNF